MLLLDYKTPWRLPAVKAAAAGRCFAALTAGIRQGRKVNKKKQGEIRRITTAEKSIRKTGKRTYYAYRQTLKRARKPRSHAIFWLYFLFKVSKTGVSGHYNNLATNGQHNTGNRNRIFIRIDRRFLRPGGLFRRINSVFSRDMPWSRYRLWRYPCRSSGPGAT